MNELELKDKIETTKYIEDVLCEFPNDLKLIEEDEEYSCSDKELIYIIEMNWKYYKAREILLSCWYENWERERSIFDWEVFKKERTVIEYN